MVEALVRDILLLELPFLQEVLFKLKTNFIIRIDLPLIEIEILCLLRKETEDILKLNE